MVTGAMRRALLKAQLALREVVELSPRTMAAIVRNSVVMSRHDLAWRRAHPEVAATDAGSFTGAATVHDELACTFERATLHVRALSDDMVRLAWGPGSAPLDVATRDATLRGPSHVELAVESDRATLATASLRVEVSSEGVSVLDGEGHWRYRERTPLFAGAHRVLRRVLRDGERLCGLGEQAAGLDLTGGSYRMWNRDPGGSWGPGQDPLYCSIPVTVGLHGGGPVWAFHENTFESVARIGRVGHADHGVAWDFYDGALVTYVAVGELDELLTSAGGLLGFPSMPPRWALGYHHCRWGWHSDEVVGAVLEGFSSRDLPLSAVHLDIDHMDSFRVFTFDEQRFGRVDQLAATARSTGTRLVAIVDPAVRRDPDFSLYREGVDDGHFVTTDDGEVQLGTVWPGWAAFPDFTSPATREWWAGKYEALTSRGISGIWHDMNEPTSITLWGDRTLPRDSRHDMEGRGGAHAEAHNLYGLLMDVAGHAALSTGDRRPFVLSRSGWAGLQRYAWHWTADVESSPDGLRQQIATFLGLGLSSVPFTGSDLGGFTGIPSPELYVRWLELGVLSPFCRTHCVLGAPDREPWRFPPPYDAAIERLIRVRYRLLPHLYRLAADAHALGHPMLRPLDWPVAGATTGATADARAVLLGDELFVAPVPDPASSAVPVALPPGRWRRLRLCAAADGSMGSEDVVDGGREVVLDAPLGQPVALQRAGTVIVLDDAWCTSTGGLEGTHAAREWVLHVEPGDDGAARGTGYDDAGDGAGAYRRDAYLAESPDGVSMIVSWTSEGAFERVGPVGVVVHGRRFTTARCDGRDVDLELVGTASRVRLEGRFSRLELQVGDGAGVDPG
jgi:alpha-glucosidase